MLKKANIIKRLNLEQCDSTQSWIREMFDMYKTEISHKVKYDEYILSPSCFRVRAYIYFVQLNKHFKIECEIRGRRRPYTKDGIHTQYCQLMLWKDARRVYHEENSELARNLYASMHQMFTSKHH